MRHASGGLHNDRLIMFESCWCCSTRVNMRWLDRVTCTSWWSTSTAAISCSTFSDRCALTRIAPVSTPLRLSLRCNTCMRPASFTGTCYFLPVSLFFWCTRCQTTYIPFLWPNLNLAILIFVNFTASVLTLILKQPVYHRHLHCSLQISFQKFSILQASGLSHKSAPKDSELCCSCCC